MGRDDSDERLKGEGEERRREGEEGEREEREGREATPPPPPSSSFSSFSPLPNTREERATTPWRREEETERKKREVPFFNQSINSHSPSSSSSPSSFRHRRRRFYCAALTAQTPGVRLPSFLLSPFVAANTTPPLSADVRVSYSSDRLWRSHPPLERHHRIALSSFPTDRREKKTPFFLHHPFLQIPTTKIFDVAQSSFIPMRQKTTYSTKRDILLLLYLPPLSIDMCVCVSVRPSTGQVCISTYLPTCFC